MLFEETFLFVPTRIHDKIGCLEAHGIYESENFWDKYGIPKKTE